MTWDVLLVGLVNGLGYAILALGLMLVYKISRFINFSHAAIGGVAAVLLAKFVLDLNFNYWVAFVIAVATAGAVGGLIEITVVRRLARTGKLRLIVASIAIGQMLLAASSSWLVKPSDAELVHRGFPVPFRATLRVGSYSLSATDILLLMLVPAACFALIVLFRSTKMGLQIRAVASNSDGAQLAGIPVGRVSLWVWILASLISGVTAIMLAPGTTGLSVGALGFGLMTRALAAALAGRMTNLLQGFAAGVGIGLFEQLVFRITRRGGITELFVFLLVVGLLLWRSTDQARTVRATADQMWEGEIERLPPQELADRHWLPWIRRSVVGVVVLIGIVLPLLPGAGQTSKIFVYTNALAYVMAGLALLIVVGWAGQLSLGHWAFVGIGAYVAGRMAESHSLVFIMLVGGLVAAVAATLVGLPALRVRGIFLAVSTLAFATMAEGWLFSQRILSGESSATASLPAPRLPGFGELTERSLYYFALAITLVLIWGLHGLKKSGAGLRMAAARDNAKKAIALGIPTPTVNLTTFAISGFICGMAGVLWAFSTRNFSPAAFAPAGSLLLLAVVLVGGLGSLAGPLLGVVALVAFPVLVDLGAVAVYLGSGVGLLIIILQFPQGQVALFYPVRDWLARQIDRSLSATAIPRTASAASAALAVRDLTVRFGGITAVDGATVEIDRGEAVAIVGMNGAGKTTLLESISGNVIPTEGGVFVAGRDVRHLNAAYRAYFGVGRTFQEPGVFKGLSVLENVLLALEAGDYSDSLSPFLHAPWEKWSRDKKMGRATEIIEFLGLTPWRHLAVGQLSTGHQKLCDLATVLARNPTLILLDEPTAGLLEEEVEEVIQILHRVRDEFDATMVIVEHDMSVVRRLADRVYLMEAGKIIVSGPTEQILADERVRRDYLGEPRFSVNGGRQKTKKAPGADRPKASRTRNKSGEKSRVVRGGRSR